MEVGSLVNNTPSLSSFHRGRVVLTVEANVSNFQREERAAGGVGGKLEREIYILACVDSTILYTLS